ncbi:MAG: hypothetical protein HKM93_00145 [Desulfobacteraceae bacterium]|nr:hypothetical protein [Desulfobacteraceae bacterium]
MNRKLSTILIVCFLLGFLSVNAYSGTVLFTDDFETGFGNWTNAASGDNKDWTRGSGGTPSYATGPSGGADGSSYYMYLETSSGSAYTLGDTAILLGPVITATAIRLQFQYHMYGADIGTLAVDVLSAGSWINNVWYISGQQYLSDTAAYLTADVDLSSYSVSQIRFRATAAGGYTGDIAIDNVEITCTPTGPVAPVFLNDPFEKSAAKQDQPYTNSIAADAMDGNGDVISFSKVSGPSWLSVSATGELSGTPLAGDVGANTFVVSVSDGALSSTATLNILVNDNSTPTVLFEDDFESGLGNWSNVSVGDNKDWTRDSLGTTSSGTGPASGADGSMYYVYLETSSGAAYTSGDTAILQGPVITDGNIHFSFKYHMYGSNIGTLAVDVLSGGSWINSVWSMTRQQQVSNTSPYTAVDVDLSNYTVSQVRLSATAAGDYMGDIAVDDLQITTHVNPDDLDNDGVSNALDQCPGTPTNETANSVGCSASQIDTDNDGVADINDAFPLDPAEWLDSDGDGIGNNADTDDDNDGVLDVDDAFPLDASESVDTDGDGTGNNADTDDDNDGVADANDAYPLISVNGFLDSDSDGIPNDCDASCINLGMAADSDDDNDGVIDALDAFPFDPNESVDTDGDGIGNNADPDDDNDGVADINDAYPLISVTGFTDTDSDGIPNECDISCQELGMIADTDDDNDGVLDVVDAFPVDANESIDTDGDLIGNNADTDDDNDGILDVVDAFTLVHIGTNLDADGDGAPDTCDNACLTAGMSADIDADGDGLIEIYTLNHLNNIRNNMQGTAYNDGSADNNIGCGDGVNVLLCSGYELMNDLNFDEDGGSDLNDTYNTGFGWQPIGDSANPFEASFDGNGFVIRNLFIDRDTENFIGLFGYASASAAMSNLRLDGQLSSITGLDYVGALVGYNHASVDNVSSTVASVSGNDVVGGLIGYNFGAVTDSFTEKGLVTGYSTIGGLAGASIDGSFDVVFSGMNVNSRGTAGGLLGYADNTIINNSFSTGSVSGYSTVGGFIGYAVNVMASQVYSSGGVAASSGNEAGGLVGQVYYGLSLSETYWDTVSSGMDIALGSGVFSGDVTGLTVTEIRCPTAPELAPVCASTALYSSWNETFWDFGSVNDYPGLKISGITYTDDDLDNDGVSDAVDAFPNDINEWADADGDGMGDNADACDATLILNSDNDADGCDDATEDLDDDNDGIPDTLDTYPFDFDNDQVDDAIDNCHSIPNLQQLNSDTDNYGDACDVDDDGDGLIEIGTLTELDNIRNNRSGTAYDNGNTSTSLGCGDGAALLQCNGYELIATLDFDENQNLLYDDSYNTGDGWSPIGNIIVPFDTIFDGNGFQILNIYISSTIADYVGLFSHIGSNGLVRNLGMTGSLTSITADTNVSILAGSNYGVITNVYTSGNILSLNHTAGGITALNQGTISNSWSNATVESYDNVGGLVGWNYTPGATISHSYSTGVVTVTGGTGDGGGLVGLASGSIIESYWDTQTSMQTVGYGALNGDLVGNPVGLTTAQMQCPIAPETHAACFSSALYTHWDTALWDFGSSSQYPALISNGILQREF